jgi:hypothetical protein
MDWNLILEHAIIGKVIEAMIDDGYRLEISDQDGGGLFVYAAPNGEEKPKDGYKFWVRLVSGNGADVISDYTTNLEATLKPVNDFAAQFQR